MTRGLLVGAMLVWPLLLAVEPQPAAAVCTACGGTTVGGATVFVLIGSTLAACALVIYLASGPMRAVLRRETEVAAAASRAASTDSAFGEQQVRAVALQLFRERHAGELKAAIRVHYLALDRPGGRVGVRISSGGIEEYWTLVRSAGRWTPDTIEDRKARKQMLARPIVT